MSQVSAKAIASKTSLALLPFLSIVVPAGNGFAQVVSAEGSTVVDEVGDRLDITGGQNTSDNTNLFHSFDQFDITSEQTANFVTGSEVQNVIGTINGGGASTLDGTLQVSGSDASLYLMNSAGILVGPNAQLNLSGGFTATTATSLEFEGGYAHATSASDYSDLSGNPQAFHFATEQPGAVVNLGDLSVAQGQTLSLVGGTVVNGGKLDAQEGTVAIAAVAENNTVRLSQQNQLLSLEIEAGAFSTGADGAIAADSIGEMLTGAGLTNATALMTQADGTIRLGQTPVDEDGGNAIISESLSTLGTQGSSTAYVAATNDILLTELADNKLDFPVGSSLTFAADADGSGTGRFEMDQSNQINADSGTINISGAGITAGSIGTDLSTNNGSSGGDISLISSREVSVNAISTNVFAGNGEAGDGGDIRVVAGGDIFVSNRIKSWSFSAGDDAGRGGDVVLEAEGDIEIVGTEEYSSILSYSDSRSEDAGDGGSIALTSRAGNIFAERGLNSRSLSSDDAESGGAITLLAPSGEVRVGPISSTASAIDNAEDGGDVLVEARDIRIESINASASDQDGQAGAINLLGSERVVVEGNLLAIGGEADADIVLTGDFIDLVGTNDSSVIGKTVWLRPATIDLDIEIGGQNGTAALDILQRDINTIRNVDEIIIGRTDGTGTVRIEPSAIAQPNARPPISIIGGETLVGPNESDNRFSLTGQGQGRLLNSNLEFANIERLVGGNLTNRFLVEPGVSLEGFSLISGGMGTSTISYENSPDSVIVNLGAVEIDSIERITSNNTDSTLQGDNVETLWNISAENGGTVNGVVFEGFSNLIGGTGEDRFEVADDGAVSSIVGGNDSNDVISYSNSSPEVTIAVSAEQASGVSSFSGIEQIESSDRNISLTGSDTDDTFFIVGDRTASFNGIVVSGIQNITGGAGTDTLDYGGYGNRVSVNAANQTATGLSQFSSIENIIGSADDNDVVAGSDSTDVFEIVGDHDVRALGLTFSDFEVLSGQDGTDTITLYGLPITNSSEAANWSLDGEGNSVVGFKFDAFESLVGSTGPDTFDISEENFPSNLSITGGSEAGNRITTDSKDSTWVVGNLDTNLPGKDTGELRQGNETLLAFSEIQNLQNDSQSSQGHTVSFLNYRAQITESIDSGVADLTLVGDDINVGRDDNANNIGGKILGEGRLTIRPQNPATRIELGGTDTGGLALNISEGEIDAIQDGFSEIVFGGVEQVGKVQLLGDVGFADGVVLRSQGNIDIGSHELLTSQGNIELSTAGSISGDTITALNGGIALDAFTDIETGEVIARGQQGISIISQVGSITANGTIDSSGDTAGGEVTIAAKNDVSVENVVTTGSQSSGNVNIDAETGSIAAGGITTANGDSNDGISPRSAGSVELESQGSISIEFIDARSPSNDNTEITQVSIQTNEDFSATGSIANAETRFFEGGSSTAASISTVGAKDGAISISYGNSERNANLFQIGGNTTNGTAFRLETAPEIAIVSGNIFSSYYQQENIQLFNNGYFPPEAPIPATSEVISTVFDIPEVHQISLTVDTATPEIYQQIEERNNQAFEDYWGTDGSVGSRKTGSVRDAQNALEEIQQDTGVNPALVYVYFVPDAASDESVRIKDDGAISPSDQLEVMLVTQDGVPIRRRQWGVTRQQVDEAGYTLRQQATSQFSTSRQYLPPAQQLYDWIVRPISETLQAQNVSSLGFVMDTGLRTLPISALHDGDRYLVENYSLGLLPSFSLSEIGAGRAHRSNFNETRVLAMGASRFENQPDLPAVEAEVNLIANNLWQGDSFLNESFVLETLQNQLAKEDYGVIHLATHAVFEPGRLENSYIQLWDDKLHLNELNDLKLDQEDLSMIILSACNTAVGDRSAEYGFAGLAVSAGAQSALASLWPVNDEGTLGFMTQFYNQLQSAAVRTEALQQAQVRLINGEVGITDGKIYGPNNEVLAVLPELEESGRWDFSHPFYWSAFTMIGNPW